MTILLPRMIKLLSIFLLSVSLTAAIARSEEHSMDVLEALHAPQTNFENMTLREFGPWLQRETRKADPTGRGVTVKFRLKGSFAVEQEDIERKLGFKIKGGERFRDVAEFVASLTRTRIGYRKNRTIEIIAAIDF